MPNDIGDVSADLGDSPFSEPFTEAVPGAPGRFYRVYTDTRPAPGFSAYDDTGHAQDAQDT